MTRTYVCRCLDPTEFGTYMNAILCQKCRGIVIPAEPLKSRHWKCEQCNSIVHNKEVGTILSLIGSVMKGFDETDFKFMCKFLNNKLSTLVPDNNESAIEIKYRIVWLLGYQPGFTWTGL